MSQANPIRLFVTHLWEDSDDYLRVFEYLESSRNFFYRNSSKPELRPRAAKEAFKEEWRKQISPAEVIVALSSLYETSQDLLTFQLLYAQASQKPVVLMKPFGSEAPVPKALADLADEIGGWDEGGVVEGTNR